MKMTIYGLKAAKDMTLEELRQGLNDAQEKVWHSTSRAETRAWRDRFNALHNELKSRGYTIVKYRALVKGNPPTWSVFERADKTFVFYRPQETTHTNQCTTRAFSKAFGENYTAIRAEQERRARAIGHKWNDYQTTDAVMAARGFVKITLKAGAIRVGEIARTLNFTKAVIGCQGRAYGRSRHLVAVQDGHVYDSWDSTSSYANRAYVPAHDFECAAAKLRYWNAFAFAEAPSTKSGNL